MDPTLPMRMAASGGADSEAFLAVELSYVVLLSIAALVAIFIRRVRLPYTVALVLAGLALALFPEDPLHIRISSDLILALLVPPLIFEATLHLRWEKLRANLAPVLLLAILGSLIGTTIVAWGSMRFLNLPLAAAAAFGALISATDPVAVIAFFRNLGVSKRLAVLVEGESLFNDGIAIVLFGLAVSLAGGETLTFAGAFVTFVRVAFGGLGIGLVLGYVVAHIVLKRVDDHLIETATTLALAYGSFVIAETLHLSGILALVAAGLVVGNVGFQNTSPTTKITLDNFWEFLAFVANSIVFLLIGLRIDILQFSTYLPPVALAVMLVLVSRALIVYGLTELHGRARPRERIPTGYRHVLYWGGLRGAISLALVLTLSPENFPGAPDPQGLVDELRIMTFGVVLFTLLVQGMTIERVIQGLGLADRPPQRGEQQRRQALVYARKAGKRELERLHEEGILADDIWRSAAAVYDQEVQAQVGALRDHFVAFPELEQEMVLQTRADLLRAERGAVVDAARRGLISERVYGELVREMDDRIAALEILERGRSIGIVGAGDGAREKRGSGS